MTSKYSQSGVDVNKNETIVKEIKEIVEGGYPEECNQNKIFSFGNFGGLIPIPQNVIQELYQSQKQNAKERDQLLLVSSMDGVGTKTDFVNKYKGIKGFSGLGYDLINHCINDTVVGGGIPLCFLDYIASSKLDTLYVAEFIKGLVSACKENSYYLEYQITLVGGESAEMPDTYQENKYDLVGTMIGYQYQSQLEKQLLNPILKGDIVIGFKSSSPHTNGYSLLRRGIISDKFTKNPKLLEKDKQEFIDWCCTPHRSYLDVFTKLKKLNVKIKKSIHITGGGWKHNPPRVLPPNLKINFDFTGYWNDMFDKNYWDIVQEITETSIVEMFEVFNCGVGLMMIIDKNEYQKNQRLFDNDFCIKKIGVVSN